MPHVMRASYDVETMRPRGILPAPKVPMVESPGSDLTQMCVMAILRGQRVVVHSYHTLIQPQD